MMQRPPQGTKIKIESFNGHQLVVVPHENACIMRYFVGTFIIFWLGGRFMGYVI